MPEFLTLLPPPEALAKLLAQPIAALPAETIPTEQALGRILAEPVEAAYPLPSFPRTTVDGYAVRAADTHGASDSLPAYLTLVGEVPMGSVPEMVLIAGQCALIHTGGMLPEGADGVVMVEYTQVARQGEVEILRAVAVGENVLQIGEDVAAGQQVIAPGTRLRPAELGGLMALGITAVSVTRQPRIGIISSGDEVIPPAEALQPGQVRDVNSYTLHALAQEVGAVPVLYGIVADTFDSMRDALQRALDECDLVVITAGSSASTRDLTAQVIDHFGPPGVLVHGVNVRPGKPTILGLCASELGGKPVIGLPGNPVSALVIAGLFVTPVVARLQGLAVARPRPSVPARLKLNLSSQAGREDWVAVQLLGESGDYAADPIFGKSNLIFTLARADGLVRIPAAANGLEAGALVDVWLM